MGYNSNNNTKWWSKSWDYSSKGRKSRRWITCSCGCWTWESSKGSFCRECGKAWDGSKHKSEPEKPEKPTPEVGKKLEHALAAVPKELEVLVPILRNAMGLGAGPTTSQVSRKSVRAADAELKQALQALRGATEKQGRLVQQIENLEQKLEKAKEKKNELAKEVQEFQTKHEEALKKYNEACKEAAEAGGGADEKPEDDGRKGEANQATKPVGATGLKEQPKEETGTGMDFDDEQKKQDEEEQQQFAEACEGLDESKRKSLEEWYTVTKSKRARVQATKGLPPSQLGGLAKALGEQLAGRAGAQQQQKGYLVGLDDIHQETQLL